MEISSTHALSLPQCGPNPPPLLPSSSSTVMWEKLRPSRMLEAIMDQATRAQLLPPTSSPDFIACLTGPQPHRSSPPVMDVLIPCAAHENITDPGFGRKRARVKEAGLVCANQGSTAAPVAGKGGKSTLVMLDTCEGMTWGS